jgi:hypothetical protein
MLRRGAWLIGFAALVASGAYVLVYIYRWEWNRALMVGLLFVAMEVAFANALVLRRLANAATDSGAASARVADSRTVDHLRATRPTRRHFAWLEDQTTGLSVFVTLLLGAGLVLTLGTWIVDRVATRTAVPTLERSLAARLDAAAFPKGPLVPDDRDLLAAAGPYGVEHLEQLLGPGR